MNAPNKKAFDAKIQGQLPPFDETAEQALLGACFLDPTVMYDVLTTFHPDDFYRHANRLIFQTMFSLLETEKGFDLITVTNALDARKELDTIGGPAYLAHCCDQVPTAANVMFHANVIRDKALLRRIAYASIESTTEAYDATLEVSVIANNAEKRLIEATQILTRKGFLSMAEIAQRTYTQIEQMQEKTRDTVGLSSGFYDLDWKLGGFEPGKLYLLAARPAMGKSIFAMNVALHVTGKENVPVAMFNLEMDALEIGMRAHCALARVDSTKIKSGTVSGEEWEKLSCASAVLTPMPFYVDDTAGQTMLDIKSLSRKAVMRDHVQMIILDYLQLISSTKEWKTRNLEIADYSRDLKILAKDLHIPILCLSQLNRDCESRSDRRPMLSDLRDSGALEQDADVVMFLYRPEVYFDDESYKNIAELIIAKHRGGPTGTVVLGFDGPHTTFVNPAQEPPVF